jgi:Ca2+-binding RTX toxin-like protein
MTPLMTLLFVALGPLVAVFHGSDAEPEPEAVKDPDAPEEGGVDEVGGETVADDLLGTLFNDTLSGLGQNDTLAGAAGDDVLSGGTGDDVAFGDAGNDSITGDAGNDSLSGGAGDDVVDGGLGDDNLVGGAGADALLGGDGNDILMGGTTGAPFDAASDTLSGGAGLDTLFLSDADTGTGGADADRFILSAGETGAVTVTDFDPAEDALAVEIAAGDDVSVASQTVISEGVLVAFDNGATVLLQGLTEEVPDEAFLFVTLEDEPADEPVPPVDPAVSAFTGTEESEIYDGPGPTQSADADLLGGDDAGTGDALNDTIAGGLGADTLSGAAGDDVLFSTSADSDVASDTETDVMDGGLGDDTLVMGNGDAATGGEGADAFVLAADVDDLVTVSDFDIAADILIVETTTPDDVQIETQIVTTEGLLISLSTGGSILLQGVTGPIDAALVRPEQPGTSTAA